MAGVPLQPRRPSLMLLLLLAWQVCQSARATSMEEMMAKMESDREDRIDARVRKELDLFGVGPPGGGDSQDALSEESFRARSAQPPDSKQIAVKRARAFMRELIAALTSEEARAKIEAARAEAPPAQSSSAADVEEDEENEALSPRQAMLLAVGPVVDKLSRGVVLKYEFEGGFPQALASVTDAMSRKGDVELKAAMETVSEILTPSAAETRNGLVPAVSSLVRRFLSTDEAGRADVVSDLKKVRKEVSGEAQRTNIDMYLAAMEGVLAQGDSYIEVQVAELVASTREAERREGRKLTVQEIADFDLRYGTLMEFLTPEQQSALEAEVAAAPRGADL